MTTRRNHDRDTVPIRPVDDLAVPANVEVEEALLGALIRDPLAMLDARAVLEPDDFFRAVHSTLYSELCAFSDLGRRYDSYALLQALEAQHPDKGSWFDVIDRCMNASVTSGMAEVHAGIVVELSRKRKLIGALSESLHLCRSGLATYDQCREAAEKAVLDVSDDDGRESRLIGEFATEVMNRLEARRLGETTGLCTGFSDFDIRTDGFGPKTLNILAARPSIGKTALALNICENVVFGSGVPIYFASLEMGGVELAERLLVSRSGVFGSKFKQPDGITQFDDRAISNAYAALRDNRLFHVDDKPSRSVAQIASIARRHKIRHDIGLVVVDYLQLIEERGGDRRASRQEQVASITRRLKIMAKELDLPVLALSQLNRKAEERSDRKPMLSDLRESGSIEQDADLVMLLHRPEFYDPNDSPGRAYLIVAKNRAGATGTVELGFNGALCKFTDWHPEYHAQEEADF